MNILRLIVVVVALKVIAGCVVCSVAWGAEPDHGCTMKGCIPYDTIHNHKQHYVPVPTAGRAGYVHRGPYKLEGTQEGIGR